MSETKIVLIDVGTHFAQEYRSLFGSTLWFWYRVMRRMAGYLLLGRGSGVKVSEIVGLAQSRKLIRRSRSRFRVVFVEANSRVVQKDIYRSADDVLCIALTGASHTQFSLTKLFFANDDEEGQGNSIYENKGGRKSAAYNICAAVPADVFAKSYKELLDSEYSSYEVVLRINCEGSEDAVVYAFKKHFGCRFKLILGSLKDVREVKGDLAFEELERFIETNDMRMTNFSSLASSWPKAHLLLAKLVDSTGSRA